MDKLRDTIMSRRNDDFSAEPIVVDQRTRLIIWHYGMFHDAQLFFRIYDYKLIISL